MEDWRHCLKVKGKYIREVCFGLNLIFLQIPFLLFWFVCSYLFFSIFYYFFYYWTFYPLLCPFFTLFFFFFGCSFLHASFISFSCLVFRKKDLYLVITQKLTFMKSGRFHVKSTQNLIKSDVSTKTLQFGGAGRGYDPRFHEIQGHSPSPAFIKLNSFGWNICFCEVLNRYCVLVVNIMLLLYCDYSCNYCVYK